MSARRLLEEFLLPLVRGGTVSAFRPIDRRGMERLLGATFVGAIVGDLAVPSGPEDAAAIMPATKMPRVPREVELSLQLARHATLQTLPVESAHPLLDSDSWRLSIVLHNLVALSAPSETALEEGSRATRRRSSLIALTTKMATLHAPESVASAMERYSLQRGLERLRRAEHQVTFWAGQRTYVGRPVPAHVRHFSKLRRVRIASTTRDFNALEPAPGTRPILDALEVSSPLGPVLALGGGGYAVSWPRMLSVIRFAPLGRLLAARILERGLASMGEVLATGLVDYSRLPMSRSEELRAATKFLAHCLWLSQMMPGSTQSPGPVLSALLHTAFSHAPSLVTPPDLNQNRSHRFVEAGFASMMDVLGRLETVGQLYEARHPGVMLQVVQRISPRNPEPIHVR
jgi:hypothetical protein